MMAPPSSAERLLNNTWYSSWLVQRSITAKPATTIAMITAMLIFLERGRVLKNAAIWFKESPIPSESFGLLMALVFLTGPRKGRPPVHPGGKRCPHLPED